MATPNFSALLPDITLKQIEELKPLFNGNKTQVVIRAIAELHKQEAKTMTKRIAVIKLDGDENAGVMTFFPLAGDQWWEPENATTVTLHLVAQHDLTAAQENYLRSNAHVMMYEVTNESA